MNSGSFLSKRIIQIFYLNLSDNVNCAVIFDRTSTGFPLLDGRSHHGGGGFKITEKFGFVLDMCTRQGSPKTTKYFSMCQYPSVTNRFVQPASRQPGHSVGALLGLVPGWTRGETLGSRPCFVK